MCIFSYPLLYFLLHDSDTASLCLYFSCLYQKSVRLTITVFSPAPLHASQASLGPQHADRRHG